MKIILLHPGQMGVSIGSALLANEHSVLWLEKGRSSATVGRAKRAGLVAYHDLPTLLAAGEAVISVCPPEAALDVARQVASINSEILYLDANAISPQTSLDIATIFGDYYVDGGIIGPPATKQGNTRLYLSGVQADHVASWFAGSLIQAPVLKAGGVTASLLKMCYAAYTKGHAALLANVRALALAGDIESALFEEWQISQPGILERSEATLTAVAPKAWRFKAEMEQIAATFESYGLPGEFHEGAAEIYDRLKGFRDDEGLDPNEVARKLGVRRDP